MEVRGSNHYTSADNAVVFERLREGLSEVQ
jgi:hypothetical protein